MKFGDGIDWNAEARRAAAADDRNNAQGVVAKIDAIERLAEHLPSRGRVLDAGSNIGRYCPAVLAAGFQYVGVDQAQEALAIARERNPNGVFVESFLWDMKFDILFDAALSFAVLQHNTLPEKQRILGRIAAAVRVGGYFVMMESTVLQETVTQLTQAGWISLVSGCGFELVTTWHPNPDYGVNDHYLFRRTEA